MTLYDDINYRRITLEEAGEKPDRQDSVGEVPGCVVWRKNVAQVGWWG